MLNDNVNIIYEKEQYIVWRSNDGYVVYNTDKEFKRGHTHLESFNRVKEVIDNMLKYNFPLHYSNYFLISMIRLSNNKIFTERLENLHQVRLAKGRKRSYKNVPRGLR